MVTNTTLIDALKEDIVRLTKKVDEAKKAAEFSSQRYQKLNEDLEVTKKFLEIKQGKVPGSEAGLNESIGSRPTPVQDAILKIFAEERRHLRLKYIHTKLQQQGMKTTRNNTWMALQRMVKKKLIKQVERGLYALAKEFP